MDFFFSKSLRSWRRGTPCPWPPGSWSPEGRHRSEQESHWWPGPLWPHLSKGENKDTRGGKEKGGTSHEWVDCLVAEILAVLWLHGLKCCKQPTVHLIQSAISKVTDFRKENKNFVLNYILTAFLAEILFMKDKQIVTVCLVSFRMTLYSSQLETFSTRSNESFPL